MGRARIDLAEGLLPDALQEVQDALTRLTGLPVLFLDPLGHPLAACEDLSGFCRHLTRGVAVNRPCLECGRTVQVPQVGPLDVEFALPRSALHHCPLGLADVAVPICCEGGIEAVLLTAQTPTGEGALAGAVEPIPRETDEWLRTARGRPARPSVEMEAIGAGLSAVAEMAATMIAARRRNLRLANRVRQQSRWIQEHTLVDAVTGLANHRRFIQSLETEIARAARYQRDLSVAVLEVEHFRRIDAELGHDTGDALLRAVAQCLVSNLRCADLVARIGGDEFAILFAETKRTDAMIALARVEVRLGDLSYSAELPAEVRFAISVLDLATLGYEGLLTVVDPCSIARRREIAG